MKNVNDNNTFWKTVKPLFTDKVQIKSKITPTAKKVISKQGLVPNLKISVQNNIDHDYTETYDLILSQ